MIILRLMHYVYPKQSMRKTNFHNAHARERIMKMKTTGITKKIDDLGRIVIPKDIRSVLGVGNGEALQFFVEGNTVILKKFGEECEFCGSTDNLTEFKGKFICEACKNDLR